MPPSSPRPILLIDDDEEDLNLTRLLLERAEIANPVITVTGGEEAVAFFRQATGGRIPYLVLCDVRMPQLDGLEVLKWVRSPPRLTPIYFAMHSGGDVPADRARARALGADEYLMKFPPLPQIRAIATHADAKREANAEDSKEA